MRSMALFLVLILFWGCSGDRKPALRVGISPWPGYEPLALAAQKGFFQKANIRIIRFSTPTESYRALRDGIIDVAAFTADEVFHYAQVRDKPRIFLILDVSNGGDALVARPHITSLEGLKGRRIGVEGSALGDYILHRAFDFATGVDIRDLQVVTVEIGSQLASYQSGEVDAVVTYEPSKSMLINAGAKVLFDSSKIPNEVVDVLVTSEQVIKDKKRALHALTEGWFKALEYIKVSRTDAMQIMAANEFLSVEAFSKAFDDLVIPSKAENRKMLELNGLLLKPMRRLARLMYEKGSVAKQINVVPLLDDRILRFKEERR